jgi:hypothetical protein
MLIVLGLVASALTGNWMWLVGGVVAHVTLNFLFEAWLRS